MAASHEQIVAKYGVRLVPDEESGGFVAECVELPGCISDGDTEEEALANIRDAIGGCVKALRDLGRPVPQPQATHLVDLSGLLSAPTGRGIPAPSTPRA